MEWNSKQAMYTITINGPEGTEVHEGEGYFLILGAKDKDAVIVKDFDCAKLARDLGGGTLAPFAFAAAGYAIGRKFTPPDPDALFDLLNAIGKKAKEDS